MPRRHVIDKLRMQTRKMEPPELWRSPAFHPQSVKTDVQNRQSKPRSICQARSDRRRAVFANNGAGKGAKSLRRFNENSKKKCS